MRGTAHVPVSCRGPVRAHRVRRGKAQLQLRAGDNPVDHGGRRQSRPQDLRPCNDACGAVHHQIARGALVRERRRDRTALDGAVGRSCRTLLEELAPVPRSHRLQPFVHYRVVVAVGPRGVRPPLATDHQAGDVIGVRRSERLVGRDAVTCSHLDPVPRHVDAAKPRRGSDRARCRARGAPHGERDRVYRVGAVDVQQAVGDRDGRPEPLLLCVDRHRGAVANGQRVPAVPTHWRVARRSMRARDQRLRVPRHPVVHGVVAHRGGTEAGPDALADRILAVENRTPGGGNVKRDLAPRRPVVRRLRRFVRVGRRDSNPYAVPVRDPDPRRARGQRGFVPTDAVGAPRRLRAARAHRHEPPVAEEDARPRPWVDDSPCIVVAPRNAIRRHRRAQRVGVRSVRERHPDTISIGQRLPGVGGTCDGPRRPSASIRGRRRRVGPAAHSDPLVVRRQGSVLDRVPCRAGRQHPLHPGRAAIDAGGRDGPRRAAHRHQHAVAVVDRLPRRRGGHRTRGPRLTAHVRVVLGDRRARLHYHIKRIEDIIRIHVKIANLCGHLCARSNC